MKIQSTKTEISRSGIGESRGFKIKASAQAFRILSDGLYSDKVKAVIRELGSNAWDAHVAAGTTSKPFIVHLPNSIEPWYSIRDYGTGLEHEQVMGLYSTYFDSTKDSSNEFTGAMGLGSKSPFSYTDAFTVTSIVNGEKRIYMIDIGDDGVPTVGLVDGSPFHTKEHNGMEIKIAAKQEDFRDFQRKAEEVFKRYPIVPKVVGVSDFEIKKVEYSHISDGWRMIKSSQSHYNDNTSYAIQGTVAYPIRTDNLQGVSHEKRRIYNSLGLELDFEIGELEVSASREDLGYDARTSKNIIDAFERALKEITEVINEQFLKYENMWDAAVALNEINQNKDGVNRLINYGLVSPKWKGKDVNTSSVYVETSVDFHVMAYNQGDYTNSRVVRNYKPNFNRRDLRVAPHKTYYFVLDDAKVDGPSRFKHYVENNAQPGDRYFMIRNYTAATLKEFIELIGYGKKPFLLASSFPKPPKNIASGGSRPIVDQTIADLTYFTNNTHTKRDRWSASSTVELKDVEYTIDVFQSDIDYYDSYNKAFNYKNCCPSIIYRIALALKVIKSSDKVYGVPRNLRKRVSKNAPNRKDLVDEVKKYIDLNKTALLNEMKIAADAHAFRQTQGYNFPQTIRPFSFLNKKKIGGKAVTEFFDSFSNENTDEQWLNEFREGAKIFKIELSGIKGDPSKIKANWQTLIDTYPMIKYINTYGNLSPQEEKDLREYVNLVDKS